MPQHHSDSRILNGLNDAMTTLLSRDSSQSRSVSAYLRNLVFVYKLEIDEFDLLQRAYIRAVDLICQGKVTHTKNLVAYLKKVAFNIAREERRASDYHLSLNEEVYSGHDLTGINIDDELQQVADAFKRLEKLEQLLLQLKIVENKSWEEIHNQWPKLTGEVVSISCLRKRKERVLKRLRHLYHGYEDMPGKLTLQSH